VVSSPRLKSGGYKRIFLILSDVIYFPSNLSLIFIKLTITKQREIMRIQFIGAAQTVTGSMHLIEVNNKKFLLDCGLYQGKRKEAFEINRKFEYFDPAEIDFVILSHAHIDHAGNLPSLVKKGFKGNIYSTFATKDLATIMLMDSAHIQEKDVEFVNKRRKKIGRASCRERV